MLPRVGRTVTFSFTKTVGYVFPVLTLGKHDDAGFADNGNAYQHHDQDDEGEAEHYVFWLGIMGLVFLY